MLNVYICFKHGFGTQVILLANALRLYDKSKINIILLKDIKNINYKYNYEYSSILPNYLDVNHFKYVTNETTIDPEIKKLFNDVDYCDSVFRNKIKLPNSLFLVYPPVFMKNIVINKCIGHHLQRSNPFILAKYCALQNMLEFKQNFETLNNDIDMTNRIGVHLRFFTERRITEKDIYNNSNIWTAIKFLRESRNKKFYISIDDIKFYRKLNINKYIHSSNDIFLEYDEYDEYVDILDKDKTLNEQILSQKKAIQVAYNLTQCSQFVGTIRSGFSKVFVPFLKLLTLADIEDEQSKQSTYNNWLFKNSKRN